jgi:hypothetical protein
MIDFEKLKRYVKNDVSNEDLLSLFLLSQFYLDGIRTKKSSLRSLDNLSLKGSDKYKIYLEMHLYALAREIYFINYSEGHGLEKIKELLRFKNIFYINCLHRNLDINPKTALVDQVIFPSDEKVRAVEQYIVDVYFYLLNRIPSREEIDIWRNNIENHVSDREFFNLIKNSEELLTKNKIYLKESNDIQFLSSCYQKILSRGISAPEIDFYLKQFRGGALSRKDLVLSLFEAESTRLENKVPNEFNDVCTVLGTGITVSQEEWNMSKKKLSIKFEKPLIYNNFPIPPSFAGDKIKVSIITSLYKGGEYIESFLNNIVSSIGFEKFVELIIIDANSPEMEKEVIQKYQENYSNIKYVRTDTVIGIYEAWNIAVKMASGDYITNANLDDLRRGDSFMIQSAVLENLKFVDVVYQDLFYTFDPFISFEEIALIGIKTKLPIVNVHNMMQFNSPHNAPMWRASLHKEIGYFDEGYKSAGDYDFWIRALLEKKTFYKINDPIVAYFQNPKGLSTNQNSRGVSEAMSISKKYFHMLMPSVIGLSDDDFLKLLGLSSINIDDNRYDLVYEALRMASIERRMH